MIPYCSRNNLVRVIR